MAFENLQLGVMVEQRQEVKWFGITFDLNCLRLLYFVNVILKDLFFNNSHFKSVTGWIMYTYVYLIITCIGETIHKQ